MREIIEKVGNIDDQNVIKKSGSWFSYGETKLAQGRDAVKQLLLDNPELAEFVEDELNSSNGIEFGQELGFEDIINILSYLMYAMERQDWKTEFIQALELSYEEEARQEKPKAPHLKVVK